MAQPHGRQKSNRLCRHYQEAAQVGSQESRCLRRRGVFHRPDLQVARAQAEKRRAAAAAREQEMQAAVVENRAKVVEAEAAVPMAIADAFRNGRLGVMDYYNLRNLQSDTQMRNAIAGTGSGSEDRGTRLP